MTNELELGRRGYFAEALFEQHNVIVVLGSAALSLSFASVWPLGIALGLECSWLLAAPRSTKFRAFVQRREREEQRSRRVAELKPRVDELDARAAARFAALEALSLSVFESAEERGTADGELSQLRSVLERLSRAFLEFCALQAGLTRAIDEIPHAELSAELARAGELFATERNLESRVALRQEQKLIQQRLLRRENLLQAERAAGVKLGAIENAATYLRSRVLVSVGGAELVNEAETLLARIGSPRSLEAVLREQRAEQP